jgi:copper oxidase (laccase) domain-containing protein
VRERFSPEDAGCFRSGPRGRPHLDVRAANVRQLLDAGLDPARLQHIDECTFCEAAAYHSYRREGQGAGRMVSFVGFRDEAGA